ncbi:MAG TPA: tetratricopeptide repeat protein [Polyangia bacterium]|nr:tetratricopeptide repeat protein [Polyangia bacterium]
MRASSALVVVTALAVSAPVVAAPSADEQDARRLFQKAELSFNLGKFDEALADYQAAYQAKPLPGFVFNIAQCYRNLGNWERARFFYRRYLALEPRSPNRHRVEDLVAEMTDKIDKQQAQERPMPPSSPTAVPAPVVVAPVEPVAPPAVAAPPLPMPAPTPVPAPETAAAIVVAPAPAPVARPVYARWWFWAGVGVVAAGGVVAALVLAKPTTRTPGTLDPIDAR